MKLFNTCALCATLAVPALVQTAQAESAAEEFITLNVEIMEAFAEVSAAIVSDEATIEEGAAAIDELTAALIQLQGTPKDMSEADLAELAEMMQDKDLEKAMGEIEAGIIAILTELKGASYGDSADLKAACEAFATAADIKY